MSILILLYVYQDGEAGQQCNQQWRSMTERFRYPPKGYADYAATGNPETVAETAMRKAETRSKTSDASPVNPQSNTTPKATLTSTVSQKIHMDRRKIDKGVDRHTKQTSGFSKLNHESGSGMKHYKAHYLP